VPSPTDLPPAKLRELAAAARRLAAGVSSRDAEQLQKVAREFDAQAEAAEAASSHDITMGGSLTSD